MSKKPNTTKCATAHCGNKRVFIPKKQSRYCYKCLSRQRRARQPLIETYNNLRMNAKRRGIDFLLTRDEFNLFCEKTNYLEKKGRTGTSCSIDRIDINKGYSLDNIQVLDNSTNILKMNFEYARCKRENVPFFYTIKQVQPKYSSDPNSKDYVPF